MVWVYIGPPESCPLPPNFAVFNTDPDHLLVTSVVEKCNFVQVMEGFVDSSQVNSLHQDSLGAASSATSFQDRDAMKAGLTFTGLPNFVPEGAAMTLSRSPIYDRSKEHLVPATSPWSACGACC